jgi:hypothetical protein
MKKKSVKENHGNGNQGSMNVTKLKIRFFSKLGVSRACLELYRIYTQKLQNFERNLKSTSISSLE